MSSLHPSAQRVQAEAEALGLEIEIMTFATPTRTAQQAADLLGCDVSQIVKSLCFTVRDAPVMALVSGAHQLEERKLAAVYGVGRKKIRRADAALVKAATGFPIGGVAPFGHLRKLPLFIDAYLTRFEWVYAAAGTPNTLFAIESAALVAATGGQVLELHREK